VAGNHDWIFQKDRQVAENALNRVGAVYLQDSEKTVGGLRIYGSPWQPIFCDWAFNLSSPDLKEKWARIPEGLDILVTHGPPHGYGDLNPQNEHVGCEHLLTRIDEVKPRYHVFGHLHGAYGRWERGSTTLINASICNEAYDPLNQPVLIEVGQPKEVKTDLRAFMEEK
jgi:hypothetical protein